MGRGFGSGSRKGRRAELQTTDPRDEAARIESISHFNHLPNDDGEMTQSDLFARQPNRRLHGEWKALKERSVLEMKKDDEGSRRILMYGRGRRTVCLSERTWVSSLFPGGGEGMDE